MKIIISGIITGSIILNALVFPMTSVSAHNNDLVSSAVRAGAKFALDEAMGFYALPF